MSMPHTTSPTNNNGIRHFANAVGLRINKTNSKTWMNTLKEGLAHLRELDVFGLRRWNRD